MAAGFGEWSFGSLFWTLWLHRPQVKWFQIFHLVSCVSVSVCLFHVWLLGGDNSLYQVVSLGR